MPSPRAASTVSRSTLETPAQLLVRIGGIAKTASAMTAVFVVTPNVGNARQDDQQAERRDRPGHVGQQGHDRAAAAEVPERDAQRQPDDRGEEDRDAVI